MNDLQLNKYTMFSSPITYMLIMVYSPHLALFTACRQRGCATRTWNL